MGRVEFLPPSRTIVEEKSGHSLDTTSLPVSKDGQELSFEDVLRKAYGDFPKLKMHANLHPSEYKNAIDLINGLPAQLQDKWRLLRLCLWNQYGSSIFGEIFNLTPDKTRKETALLSDLPDGLTNMVSELLEEGDDQDEEETAKNTTTVLFLNKYNIRVNPEKREFVILAEGGQKWKTLTDRQRFVLKERYLADHPATLRALAGQLGIIYQTVAQTEAAGLRKLGFFGDAINLTKQQLQNIFKNATEEDLNSLIPKERELLERLYGGNINNQHSYPTIKSAAADINVHISVANRGHQTAMQKLIHTKSAIYIDRSLSPTSEQVEFMRQQIPLQGTDKVAKEMGRSQGVVRRWRKKEGIQLRQKGRIPMLPSSQELEFIKTNYPNKTLKALGKLTGHWDQTITRWLRDAGVTIRKRGGQQKITP